MNFALAAFVLILCAGAAPGPSKVVTRDSELRLADEIAKEVESLRGWKFTGPVEKGIYTESELRAFIEKRLVEEYPEAELSQNEMFLRRIGALPESTPLRQTLIDVLMSQIGGFYDPPTRTFYMIERPDAEYGRLMDRILLAHELTHALDDQHVSLDSLMEARERTQDGEFVVGALVEGSATEVMTRFVTQAQFSGELKPEDLQDLMESEEKRSRVFFESPRYFQSLLANYTCGMYFLLKGQLGALVSGPASGVNAGENFLIAVKDLPRSSEQILHPEKYWDAAKRDEPVRVDAESARRLWTGFDIIHENTAGELLAAILTTPANQKLDPMSAAAPTYWTNTAAEGWGGDRFYLIQDPQKKGAAPASVWITLWDSAKDREEFESAYRTIAKPLTPVPIGKRGIAFLHGFSKDQESAMAKKIAEGGLRFTRGGKAWDPKASS